MKQKFAELMQDKNFRGAAELIFNATLHVQAPRNVNLNINIDREQNISDLTSQMESCYNQINESYSEMPFEKLWTEVFTRPELQAKQNLQTNDAVLSNAKTAYSNIMNKIKRQQYEQFFETITLTLNASLQGLVDAAALV